MFITEFFKEHTGAAIGILAVAVMVFVPFIRNLFLQTFFGIVFIPEDSIGLVIKKWVLFGKNKELPEGRIIATNGEAGYQAQTLAPGVHFWLFSWQYQIKLQQIITIPGGKLGLIRAKDGALLNNGDVLGRYVECDNFQDAVKFINNNGFKGRQTKHLMPGSYRINTLLFDIETVDAQQISNGKVGIVTVRDGKPLEDGAIAGKKVDGHNKYQTPDVFLNNNGRRGLQEEVILSGLYYINPWFAEVREVDMTVVPIGYVGVVISYFGEKGVDVSGENFKHGNIVSNGQIGVWAEPLQPGKYPLNTEIYKVEQVPTTNLVLNWADSRTEAHNLDENLSTITVRSQDGFTFNLDVSQIIHIPMIEAPKVIARFGNMKNLVNQVLEPTIGNYFRNSAQNSDVIQFLNNRKGRQEEAKSCISAVLTEYNVNAVDTLIGDITPPGELMKTLTDRKIAQEQDSTYKQKIQTEKTRQDLEKASSLADIQKDIVKAEQGVQIAEKIADAAVKKATGEKDAVKLSSYGPAYKKEVEAKAEAGKIEIIGKAEASKIEIIGKATADAYERQSKAIGSNNLAAMKITEAIGVNKIKVMPDVLIGGSPNGSGGNTALEGLLGMQLVNILKPSIAKTESDANQGQVAVDKKDVKENKQDNK